MVIEEYFLGKTARAKHPITVFNPEPTFIITKIEIEKRSDGHVVKVKGENTCRFGKNYWELVDVSTLS